MDSTNFGHSAPTLLSGLQISKNDCGHMTDLPSNFNGEVLDPVDLFSSVPGYCVIYQLFLFAKRYEKVTVYVLWYYGTRASPF